MPPIPDRSDWREPEPESGPSLGARLGFAAVLASLALVFVGTLAVLEVDLADNALLVALGTLAFVVGTSRAFYMLRDRHQAGARPVEIRVIDVVDAERGALPFSEGRALLSAARSRAPTEQADGTWRVYNLSDGGHACYCPSTQSYRLSREGGDTARFESAAALARHLEGSRRLTRVAIG